MLEIKETGLPVCLNKTLDGMFKKSKGKQIVQEFPQKFILMKRKSLFDEDFDTIGVLEFNVNKGFTKC